MDPNFKEVENVKILCYLLVLFPFD